MNAHFALDAPIGLRGPHPWAVSFDASVYRRLNISTPGDIGSAAILLRDTVRAMAGLDVTASHDISSSRPMEDAHGEPLASHVFAAAGPEHWWLDRSLALKSPLIAASRVSALPFWCNARGIHAQGGRRILPDIDLSCFAKRSLTRCAIVVPVHLPLGQLGVASLLSPDPECEDLGTVFDACVDVLALYVARFLTSYVSAMQEPSRLARHPVLSRREVECLRWASGGKTNDEIGLILGLSRGTVRFHIRNASIKLDAVNRDQTVFKASQLGYLPTSR